MKEEIHKMAWQLGLSSRVRKTLPLTPKRHIHRRTGREKFVAGTNTSLRTETRETQNSQKDGVSRQGFCLLALSWQRG